MTRFELYLSDSSEPDGSTTNPELLDAFVDGAGFHTATVKFDMGVPFLAHARKPAKQPAELKVRMSSLERTFVHGAPPLLLSCPTPTNRDWALVDELHLGFGQFQQHATLLPSGEVLVTLNWAWLHSVRRKSITLGSCVRDVVKNYETVFLPEFANR